MFLISLGKALFIQNQKTKMKANEKHKPKKSKFLFLGLGVGVIALGGLGYWYFVGRKGVQVDNANDDIIKQLSHDETPETPKPKSKPKVTVTASPKESSAPASASMLLKKGSKGPQVKQLQEALINKYGKTILPKYGADGDFGSEVETALKTKGYPTQIDLATFNKIVSPDGQTTSITSM